MRIAARLANRASSHDVTLDTAGVTQSLAVAAKATGGGSAVNGGEFLMLALATCYCNDLYREAKRLQILLERVEVEATAKFEGIGLAASDIHYRAKVSSPAAGTAIAELLRQTDAVAEVHNTIRVGVPVELDLQ